ncbi:MAG: DNA polymerase/3'-5' exonuclease PolX [Candidatus Nealsonbacteria bacterium]|nr:DNA polymerase/3'-5' exonuclease PolX [Candidatus Nealsonbacteria bacterium]
MKNQELVKIFSEIAIFLEMDDIAFRPQAYEKAALALEALEQDVAQIYQKEGVAGLKKIPGVGETLAERIEEYLKTGQIKYYRELRKKMPVDLAGLLAVEGIGPKTIKELYLRLGIKNPKDLERAARAGKIRALANFGEKTEKNILQGLEFLRRQSGRFLLGEILPETEEMMLKLRELKEVERISLAGSLRRRKETIGDADILVVSQNPRKVVDFFVTLPGVVKVWGQGTTKASIRLRRGIDIDLRIVPRESYGAALQYFTGSKEHNILTRKLALEKGLKLNEYGLFRGRRMIASQSEEDVYRALGLPLIEPELRENQGEIQAAQRGQLPRIIGYGEIQGDLHCHSDWDGGRNTILEMARAAQKRGYHYLGISDHTQFLKIERGLDERQLLRQRKEIDKLNAKFYRFQILQGCEANILNDGSIDIKDSALAKLDFVIAGVHSSLKMAKAEMTRRLIRATRNPHVDIISHPTGRLLQRRDEYQIDFDSILRAARETKTVLEINASPERLDLKDANIRRAGESGVKMVISTDSHAKEQMKFIDLGIAQARRGWAEPADIINCWPLARLRGFFKP